MSPKKTFEIWCRKKDKNGQLTAFSFIRAFRECHWQFAIKLRKRLVDKGYQVVLRELTVTKEEKLGTPK